MHPVAAGLLRRLAGAVGGGEHRGHVGVLGRNGHDTDAGAQPERALFPGEFEVANRFAQRLGGAHGFVQRTALEQYPELIAAQARQGIAPADFGFEQRPDLTQQGIAGAVPAGVVDDLELIQIETAQGIRGFVRLGALQGAFHAVLEFTAIHQSGEHVVTRVIAQTPVQLARFAHIMEHQHAARHRAAAVANGRCRAFDIDFVAVAANQQHRPHRLDGARAADGDRQRIFQRFARFLVECAEDLLDRPALAILETPSGERLGDRVQIVDHALGVGGDDAVADALQSDLRALLLAEQRFLVELALGDIEFDADQPQ